MKKLFCLLFILLIIFSGCVGKNPVTTSNSAKGSITLAIKLSGLTMKTIQPDLDMNIATYDVYGAGPSGTNFRKNDQSGSTVSLEALAAGFWTITVDAKNDEGIIIASGFTDVTVIAGINTEAAVTVTPLTGTGALRINMSWPGGVVTNPVINATLAPKGGAAAPINFTLSGDCLSAVYEDNAIAAGYYTLIVYLYDGSVFKWGAAEAVRIIKDQTSEGNYPVIPGGGIIGDINLIITPDLQNPVDITFSGAVDNLAMGANMTVTATTSEEVESYQWYLNGKPLSGETSNTITIGSALPQGNYRLDLVVAKRMILSSGTVNFTVTETGAGTIVAIAGGEYHNIVLKNDGTVWAWGYNDCGQLGNGTNTNYNLPVQVVDLTGVIAIASEGFHNLALKNDGTVWAWGDNSYGQLGDGTGTNRNFPVQVSGLSGIIAIAGGSESRHSLALKNDGTVWSWGYNNCGQLGDGTYTNQCFPVQVQGLAGVIAIASGQSHSLAVKDDGTVWAWGMNAYGQLGDGTVTYRNLPAQVAGLFGVTSVAAGWIHSIALRNDGTVWAWGNNEWGQLGDGNNKNREIPVVVTGLNGVTAISGRYTHNFALKNDGSVWAWGRNDYGQIGDGPTINWTSAAPVPGLNGITAIACGWTHSLALKNNGSVWAWGYNDHGQLGDGTFTNRYTPGEVSGF